MSGKSLAQKVGTQWLIRVSDVLSASDLERVWRRGDLVEAQDAALLLSAKGRVDLLAIEAPWADDLFLHVTGVTGWLPAEALHVLARLTRDGPVDSGLAWAAIEEVARGRVAGVRVMLGVDGGVSCWMEGSGWVVALPRGERAERTVGRYLTALQTTATGTNASIGLPLEEQRLPSVSVAELKRLQTWDGPAWPCDNKTVLGRLELERRTEVIAALRDAANARAEGADWALASLVRLRWVGVAEVATRSDLDRLAGMFPEAAATASRWDAFCEAVISPEATCAGILECLPRVGAVDKELAERVYGVWIARTQDLRGGPWLLEEAGVCRLSAKAARAAVEGSNAERALEWLDKGGRGGVVELPMMHLSGGVSEVQVRQLRRSWEEDGSAMALLWLAEAGVTEYATKVFKPLEEACYAATLNMEADMIEVAWRSGMMPELMENAVGVGGYMSNAARFWLSNDSVLDCDDVVYRDELRRVISGRAKYGYSVLSGIWCWRY